MWFPFTAGKAENATSAVRLCMRAASTSPTVTESTLPKPTMAEWFISHPDHR